MTDALRITEINRTGVAVPASDWEELAKIINAGIICARIKIITYNGGMHADACIAKIISAAIIVVTKGKVLTEAIHTGIIGAGVKIIAICIRYTGRLCI